MKNLKDRTQIPKVKNSNQTSKITLIKTHIQKALSPSSLSPSSLSLLALHLPSLSLLSLYLSRGQIENVEILCVLPYIEENENLNKLRKTIEKSIYQFETSGNVVSLLFQKNVYRLSNENLSFVPTGEIFNKKELNYDLINIFSKIKAEMTLKKQ